LRNDDPRSFYHRTVNTNTLINHKAALRLAGRLSFFSVAPAAAAMEPPVFRRSGV
jgi:hypothetical protein